MAEPRQELAMRIAIAQAQVEAETAANRLAINRVMDKPNRFRWQEDEGTPGQLNLYEGLVQVGALRLADAEYMKLVNGRYELAELPVDPPTSLIMKRLQEVPQPSPFRHPERQHGRFDESHICVEDGTLVLVKSGTGPVRGTHWHICPTCGNSWYHDNK